LLDALYKKPIASTRNGPIFNAHSYPTKINTTAIVPFILAHTKPGDIVFDGFAGTGATGLAVALCSNPDIKLQESVEGILGEIAWGPRNCILYDISELATFTARMLLDPPDPKVFEVAARAMLAFLQADWGWMYEARDDTSSLGVIRHTLWTDHVICPRCSHASTFWDLAVDLLPASIAATAQCSQCQHNFDVISAERVTEMYWDDVLHQNCSRRKRTSVFVYGRSRGSSWKRTITEADIELLERINGTPIPPNVPVAPMLATGEDRWGELYRAGYHFGITHLHHFYTRRNLLAIAAAWQAAEAYTDQIRDALRFWISSYNASHSTLMTRVVCKESSQDFVVTSAQPATLYISSLPVEKNVFAGLLTKLKPIEAAFRTTRGHSSTINVHCASSLKLDIPESSVDYIFTDPPFGDNIQYAEVNFINEAWLGKITNAGEEVIISSHQGKTVHTYQALLTQAFAEAFRILKPAHYMTVVFHSTRPAIWDAVRRAWETAGFQVVRSSILDKTQASFKQVTTEGAVRGDPVILLQKPVITKVSEKDASTGDAEEIATTQDPWQVISDRLRQLDGHDAFVVGRTRQRLYSHLITYYVERGQSVPLDAGSFFTGLDRHFQRRGEYYYITDLTI
jgi:predicted RNA methylase